MFPPTARLPADMPEFAPTTFFVVVSKVEKVVKDPETEAQNAQLQAQRAELQHQIEMLEAKQKEVAAVAERNARVKADMIEYSWSCCICTEYLVKSRLLACGTLQQLGSSRSLGIWEYSCAQLCGALRCA